MGPCSCARLLLIPMDLPKPLGGARPQLGQAALLRARTQCGRTAISCLPGHYSCCTEGGKDDKEKSLGAHGQKLQKVEPGKRAGRQAFTWGLQGPNQTLCLSESPPHHFPSVQRRGAQTRHPARVTFYPSAYHSPNLLSGHQAGRPEPGFHLLP